MFIGEEFSSLQASNFPSFQISKENLSEDPEFDSIRFGARTKPKHEAESRFPRHKLDTLTPYRRLTSFSVKLKLQKKTSHMNTH